MDNFDWHSRFVHQAAWTRSLRDYLFTQTRIENCLRVLEVGCGTGALLTELETRFTGEIFGLDLSRSHLAQAVQHTRRVCLLQSDAHAIPFPANSFDLTICHYLLLWVVNPFLVLQEMARVTRPGGYILALAEPDYGGRLDYPFQLEAMGDLQRASLRRQGANPFLGRQLHEIFLQAGLSEVQSGCLGGEWKGRHSRAEWISEWEVFEQDLLMLNHGLSREQVENLRSIDQHAWETGIRILFVPTFYARGRK